MVNLYKDSPVKQDIKTTNPRYDYHDYSITLDDVEDLSLNDSSIIENKKNKED